MVACVGFVSGGACAFVLVGAGDRVCFGVSGGSLSADDWVCVLTLLLIWVRRPALGATGSWEVLGLESVWSFLVVRDSCPYSAVLCKIFCI